MNCWRFLNDLSAPNVGINFDPANMILYGAGDPIAAVATLGRHIRHVHAKDATPSDRPGEKWGEEVPFGKGDVNPAAFLKACARSDIPARSPSSARRGTAGSRTCSLQSSRCKLPGMGVEFEFEHAQRLIGLAARAYSPSEASTARTANPIPHHAFARPES